MYIKRALWAAAWEAYTADRGHVVEEVGGGGGCCRKGCRVEKDGTL